MKFSPSTPFSDHMCRLLLPIYLKFCPPLKGGILNIAFSVTYYLEISNAIFICCISHIFPTNIKSVVWTL